MTEFPMRCAGGGEQQRPGVSPSAPNLREVYVGGGGVRLQKNPSSRNILRIFSGTGGAAPYRVRGALYLGGREQRHVLAHSAEQPKEPPMYTVGYYNDEDFRAFYSGQDAANIDDFFTDNGEYLMVYLPEVTDREFLAGLRYGNGCDALCQSGYALDEAEEALRDMYALAV